MSAPVEFRRVSGEVFASGVVCMDATVATFNEILNRMGYILPPGTRYVNGTTSIGIEERETRVCGGTWTVVLGSVTRMPAIGDVVSSLRSMPATGTSRAESSCVSSPRSTPADSG